MESTPHKGNGRRHDWLQIEIPEIYEYRNNASTRLKNKTISLHGSPIFVVKLLVDYGFKRGWFRSGSWLIWQLTKYGIQKGWDVKTNKVERLRSDGRH